MEEIREKKQQIRDQITKKLEKISDQDKKAKLQDIENRLFDFANFLEAKIVLLYTPGRGEVETRQIIRRTFDYSKLVVLPAFDLQDRQVTLMKVDDPDADLIPGLRGNLEPNPQRCKKVPLECIDIAIIPGLAMDEKGGRLGSGHGFYDSLIPRLPITSRKVGLVFEEQMIPQVPMESHDKYVDIIITEKRVIYKI